MRPPAFWFASPNLTSPLHPAARLLAPLGHAYGAMTAARMGRPGVAAPCPVLCVGNFTLGGAGKTPTAIAFAAVLRDLGRRPGFLSRGYGGRLRGPVAVDFSTHTAAEVGDEPLLLARHAPAVIAGDRPGGARLLAERADVVVMDDGLQNPSLRKTLALAVVDAGAGAGNGLPFPAGPLRAPLARQWPHVGGVVLIGDGAPGEALAREARARGMPVHRARLLPERALTGHRVLAFAGIGRPQKFFDTLEEAGATLVAAHPFPDHHAFSDAEVARLLAEADRLGAAAITTEKDRVRLPPRLAGRVQTLAVALHFADPAVLRAQLVGMLAGG